MGKVFKYISDEALEISVIKGESCPICNDEIDLYSASIDGDDEDYSEACINCIKTVPLSWIRPKDDERKIQNLINQKYPKGTKSQDQRFALVVELADEYRRSPNIPIFMQRDDWPDCCGDFTEYVGLAKSGGSFSDFILWGEEDYFTQNGIEGLVDHEDGVPLFKCKECQKRYWLFQTT